MKAHNWIIAFVLLLAGCAAPTGLQLQTTPITSRPDTEEEVLQQIPYALPRTVVKVEVTFREVRHIPGPYWEYADKYLGLKEVISRNSSRWSVWDVDISSHQETDPGQYYMMHVLEGNLDRDVLAPWISQGMIVSGNERIHESVKGDALYSTQVADFVRYEDLGVNNNFQERIETMYKTIVTDTSFVEVPVQRTVVEQKSTATRAREAADFLLELRTRRFEMLTGEYEVYPDGQAMGASIGKLDQIEASYLSLFTGKSITRQIRKTWFLVPESSHSESSYSLEMFSEILGIVPEGLGEGEELSVRISPVGTTLPLDGAGVADFSKLLPNTLVYRLPDVTSLKVMLGSKELASHRISIFQAGSLLTVPL